MRKAEEVDGPEQDLAAFGIGRLFWLMSDAIVGADVASGKVLLWNPAAARLFGYSAAEALGMSLSELVPPELREQHLAGIDRYRHGADPLLVGEGPVDVPALTKEGRSIEVALTLTDLGGTGGPPRGRVLALIRDMTAVREAERKLQLAMDAMSDFVAMASHDLRNPLSIIHGFAEILEDAESMSEAQRQQAIQSILNSADHATRLVDDLLTLSQLQAGAMPVHRQRTDIGEAARNAIASSGVEATCSIDASLVAHIDPHHLQRMLVNYLTNAARYGREPIDITARLEDGAVVVRVTDHGDGVPQNFLPRLFTRFARAGNTSTTGTGLGLSITRGLSQANGGDTFYERTADTVTFGLRLKTAG